MQPFLHQSLLADCLCGPDPLTSIKAGQNQEFTFNKNQLENSGIAMSFGTKQVFRFSLDYYIENNNLTPRTEEITLPPDNNYKG